MLRFTLLFLAILLLIVGSGVQAVEEGPLSGECLLYLSAVETQIGDPFVRTDYLTMVYNADTQESIVVFEGATAIYSTYDASQMMLVGENEGDSFTIYSSNGLQYEEQGVFFGGQINQDGDIIYASGPDANLLPTAVNIIDVETEELTSVSLGLFPTWGPDGWYAVTDFANNLTLFSPDGDTVFVGGGFSASWSPNGRYVAYRSLENQILVYDLELGENVATDWDDLVIGFFPSWVDNETILLSAEMLPPERNKLALALYRPFDSDELGIVIADEERNLYGQLVTCDAGGDDSA